MRGARLHRLVLAAWLLPCAAQGAVALPPDESRTLGTRVADAALVDASGETFRVRALEGKPLVVSPIFTRCGHACPTLTSTLRQALAGLGVPGRDFNVLSVSFDAADSEADLRRFREERGLPAGWKVARAAPGQLLPLLDSLDFRFISQADGSFAHPNLVVFLTSELRVAKYLYGVDLTAAEVRGALELASGREPLRRLMAPYLLLVGVLGTLATSLVILVTLRRRGARRAQSASSASRSPSLKMAVPSCEGSSVTPTVSSRSSTTGG